MYAELEAIFDGSYAVLIERAGVLRAFRQIIVRFFLGLEQAAFQKRNHFIENTGVANRRDVTAGDVMNAQIAIRGRGAPPPSTRRIPSVHVAALPQLLRFLTQKKLTGEVGSGVA